VNYLIGLFAGDECMIKPLQFAKNLGSASHPATKTADKKDDGQALVKEEGGFVMTLT